MQSANLYTVQGLDIHNLLVDDLSPAELGLVVRARFGSGRVPRVFELPDKSCNPTAIYTAVSADRKVPAAHNVYCLIKVERKRHSCLQLHGIQPFNELIYCKSGFVHAIVCCFHKSLARTMLCKGGGRAPPEISSPWSFRGHNGSQLQVLTPKSGCRSHAGCRHPPRRK